MKELSLKVGHPLALTLSADWRLCETRYSNDIIWELNLEGGEPEAMAVQTTFGLRAGGMRIFPRFVRKDGTISDPTKFHHSSVVQQLYPNYARIVFSPFAGMEVRAEYQVVSSSVICGRFWMHNKTILKEHFRFELVGVLNPLGNGQGIAVIPMENNLVMEGGSGDLCIVCCLGNPTKPGSGPFASLEQEIELFPNSQIGVNWALAAAKTNLEAFQLAQSAVQSRFDAGVARIELMNEAEELEISTGNPEWDAAMVLTQRAARRLIFPEGGGLPNPSFVLSRRPDQGHSISGDGMDYPQAWSGQTALDSYFVSNLLLPGGMKWVKGLVRNFLATQDESGRIDWRAGLGGQRSRRMAQPLLAGLALSASEMHGDTDWLKDVYPGLVRFIRNWFSAHDRDKDGFPEWDHVLQTGLEGSAIYDRYNPGSQGLEISVLESPALGSMLVNECRCLFKIGKLLGVETDIPWMEEQAERLSRQIQETWQPARGMFQYRDHETHSISAGTEILNLTGSGIFSVQKEFLTAQRLIFLIQSVDQATRGVSLKIRGRSGESEVIEEIPPQRFTWVNGLGRSTGRQVFTQIDSIEVNGVMKEDQVWVRTPDYTLEDISLLLPLWAGIPDKGQAKLILENAILPTWLEKYGVPSIQRGMRSEGSVSMSGVLMPWNVLVGEGLLRYGYRKEAAELVRRLMEGVVLNLRTRHDFYSQTDAVNGKALGEAGHLHGMAPLGLFLRTAGIHQLSPERLIIQTGSPFSHAITVKYKGTGVTLTAKDAQITFPSGQSIRVDEPGLHQVNWQ